MNKAYLLTGGNLNDRQKTLATAYAYIYRECGDITSASSVYETDAWGNNDQPAFLNQVIELETRLSAGQLLKKILAIEKQIGRVRKEKYGPRLIDIDILLFNDDIYDLPLLKIPHPELQNRRFALTPLAEIAPGTAHPVLKKTMTELLAICPDKLAVKRVS